MRIIVCVNENQHKQLDRAEGEYCYSSFNWEDRLSYERNGVKADLKRMVDVLTALNQMSNARPTLFIMFNPDRYRVDGQVKMASHPCTWGPRVAQLVEVIQTHEMDDTLEILYMYYDMEGGVPLILSEPDYIACVKSFVIPAIY
jgi:hypothetical protein